MNRLEPVSRRNKGLLQVLMRTLSTAVLQGLEPHLYSEGLTQGRMACQRADNSRMPNDSWAKLTSVLSVALHTEMKPGSKAALSIRVGALNSLSNVADWNPVSHVSLLKGVSFSMRKFVFWISLGKDTPKTSWWIITNNTEPGVCLTAFLKEKKNV